MIPYVAAHKLTNVARQRRDRYHWNLPGRTGVGVGTAADSLA